MPHSSQELLQAPPITWLFLLLFSLSLFHPQAPDMQRPGMCMLLGPLWCSLISRWDVVEVVAEAAWVTLHLWWSSNTQLIMGRPGSWCRKCVLPLRWSVTRTTNHPPTAPPSIHRGRESPPHCQSWQRMIWCCLLNVNSGLYWASSQVYYKDAKCVKDSLDTERFFIA